MKFAYYAPCKIFMQFLFLLLQLAPRARCRQILTIMLGLQVLDWHGYLEKKMPNNELVSFFHELACGSRCMAFSLSYLRQENLFTGYLTNEKQTGAEMRPEIVSGIVTALPFSYWPIFSMSLLTIPEVFAAVN